MEAPCAAHYAGFAKLFEADLLPAPPTCHIRWPDRIESFPGEGSASERLAEAFLRALRQLAANRGDFEVATVHWHVTLDLPALAMLLVALHEKPGFELASERVLTGTAGAPTPPSAG